MGWLESASRVTSPPPPLPSDPSTGPDEPPANGSKASWRAWARRIPGRVELPAGALAKLVGTTGWVVTWRPLADEPDPSPIEIGLGDRLALTRTPDSGGLTVHPADSPREHHRYGFEQPTADSAVVPIGEIALVLVPGLAFDRSGFRLGRGSGYFDHFLADLVGSAHLVGVCSEARVVDHLPREPHDIPMTHLLTEQGVRSL